MFQLTGDDEIRRAAAKLQSGSQSLSLVDPVPGQRAIFLLRLM
jgi:hypothetical protein